MGMFTVITVGHDTLDKLKNDGQLGEKLSAWILTKDYPNGSKNLPGPGTVHLGETFDVEDVFLLEIVDGTPKRLLWDEQNYLKEALRRFRTKKQKAEKRQG